MRKHYKIVSMPRFITFLTVCALIIIYITASVTDSVISEQLTEQTYTAVQVCEGDTLWEIAREYSSSDTDIRKTVDDICTKNSITAGELRAGDIILVPETPYI